MIYLFTRNPNGSVVSNGFSDLRAACGALQTYVATARKLGYQIEPSAPSDELDQSCCARSDTQVVTFWLSKSAGTPGLHTVANR